MLIRSLGAFALVWCLLVGTAFAGPRWTFGELDEGVLQLDYKGQFQLLGRDNGSGPNGTKNTAEFNFRRNRLALMGAYGDNLGLYVQTEFKEDNNIGNLTVTDGEGSNFTFLDAVLRFRVNDGLNVWLGKFKYNLTRENLEACEAPLTLDRSLFIRAPYVSTRDKGVALWGNLFKDKFQYRIDAMNGRNDSVSSPKSNFRYTGRAHVSLLDPERGYGYKGSYLGKKSVLTIGGAYQFESGVAYSDTISQTDAKDYKAWTLDGFFEYPVEKIGTFTVSAAYVDYDLDDTFTGSNPDNGAIDLNGEKNGSYYKVAYMLPDLPLQFFARYENWSFAELNAIFDQEVTWYGGGFNYYLRGQDLKVTMEYSKTDFDKEGEFNGVKTEDFITVVTQLQLIF